MRKLEKTAVRPCPAPAGPRRRIFTSLKAFAAAIALPFLAGSTACERHGNAAGDAASHPGPSPLTPATPAATILVDNAAPAATASTTPTPAPASSAAPSAPAAPDPSADATQPGPSPTPVTQVPIPHFTSAAANAYVQAYEAYLRDFRAAYIRMMKDADLSEYGRLIARVQELQSKGEQIEEELDPGERETFGKYLDAKAEEVRRITSEAL